MDGLLANRTLVTNDPKPLKDMRYMNGQATIFNLDNVISVYYRLIPFAFAVNVNFVLDGSNDDIDGFMGNYVDIDEAINFEAFYSRIETPDEDWF